MNPDFPQRIAFAEALQCLRDIAGKRRMPVQQMALSDALGCVLAEDLVARHALPGFANSAMDGFALRHEDLLASDATPLRLVGERFAGRTLDLAIGPGECARITTGAALPNGADTVLIKEDARLDGELVTAPPGLRRGAHVRQAGEDVAAGEVVLTRGQVMAPARVSLAAALGYAQLPVHRRPTVAVFTTGDELRPPGQPLQPGEIHDSNRSLLQGLLADCGIEAVGWPILPDDPERIAAALRDAATAFDLVLTCGGVSAGEKDHVPDLLQREGRVHFWRVRIKPGMPVLFGELGQALFLGLPGNPVSVLATFLGLGRELLDALQGRAEPRPRLHARLATALDKPHPRLEFQRGRLACAVDGVLRVEADPATGSHRLRAAAAANCLLVLPEGPQSLPAGASVEVIPLAFGQ
jgi:molybdopterin molybdotransferase